MKAVIKGLLSIAILVLPARMASAKSPLAYKSPDGKWEICATWISDDYQYDRKLKNMLTGKAYFGAQGTSAPNEFGAKWISALWSSDSHFVAVYSQYGRAASDFEIIAINGDQPREFGSPLAPKKETFEGSLLKEADKKRFMGWRHLWVSPKEWLNKTDLLIDADMVASLKATDQTPKENLNVEATITVRLDKQGHGKIVRGKYESYKKVAENSSR